MTSSNTLKKLVSIGAAVLLAVGGSLTAAAPASAAAATSAPVVSSPALVGSTVTATPGVWPSGTATGKWYVCDRYGSTAAATSVPGQCNELYTSSSNTAPITTSTLTIPSISYCVTLCTSFGNSSTAFNLRWIEVNGSDISASVAVPIREGRSLSLQNPTAGDASVTLGVSNGCNFASSSLSGFADFTLLVAGSTKTITSVTTTNSNVVLNFSGAVTNGQAISVSYTQSTDPEISCGPTSFIRNTTSALTGTVSSGGGGGGGGGGGSFTMTTSPSYTIANGVATANDGVWSGGTPSRYWLLCDTPRATANIGTPPMDCAPFYLTSTGGSYERGTTLTIPTTVWQYGSSSRTQITFASKSLALFVINGFGNEYLTPTTGGASLVTSVSSPAQPLSALQARNALKPVPAAVQPLVSGFLALNKPMASLGGKVALSAGDFTGLTSAKIGDKAIDFSLGTTGNISFTVPQGQAGKTADLVLTFTTGSIILQDAIKYVAPLDVAKVGVRPIAIAAGAAKITEEVAGQIRQAAFANVKNDTIQCVAYSASNSAAAKAAAQLTAVQACGLAVKANPSLKVVDVEVIVDKLKARTQGVGIKVYKADI